MSADEMFKELGYKKDTNVEYEIAYIMSNNYIRFNKNFMSIEKGQFEGYVAKPLTMQELQAINKKVEELGWIKEK